MNNLKNSVRLIGHLGQDPEVKSFEKGKVAKLSIATSDTYKDKDGKKVTETYWHNLVAWNGTADVVEKYLKKGSEVAIEGKLTNRSYTDKEGIKRYMTEIVVSDLMMFDKKNS